MMSHKQLLPLLVLLGVLPTVGFAQSPTPPLNFGNNFLVTGDYVVAGAYNMTTKFQTINNASYAVGTINVPDGNQGLRGQNRFRRAGRSLLPCSTGKPSKKWEWRPAQPDLVKMAFSNPC